MVKKRHDNEDNIRVNMMIEMRKTKIIFKQNGKLSSGMFETSNADILDVEQIRELMKDVEGTVDTSFVIQHQTDPTRKERVDLITLIDFFFPSRAI